MEEVKVRCHAKYQEADDCDGDKSDDDESQKLFVAKYESHVILSFLRCSNASVNKCCITSSGYLFIKPVYKSFQRVDPHPKRCYCWQRTRRVTV